MSIAFTFLHARVEQGNILDERETGECWFLEELSLLEEEAKKVAKQKQKRKQIALAIEGG